MSISEIFEMSLSLYRLRFWTYFLFFFIANGAAYALIKIPQITLFLPAMKEPDPNKLMGSFALLYLFAFLSLGMSFLVYNVLLGYVTLEVETLYLGKLIPGREVASRLVSVLFPLLVTLFLSGFITGIGFLFCILPGIILLLRFAFTAPVILMGEFQYFDAMQRSWTLTGHRIGSDWTGAVYWRVAGVFLLSVLLGWAVGLLFQMPFTMAGFFFNVWDMGQSGAPPNMLGTVPGMILTTFGEVAGVMGKSIVQPYLIIAMVVLYLDTRGRRDGLHFIFRARALREEGRTGAGGI